jgi:predicted Zn-dependent peptidase
MLVHRHAPVVSCSVVYRVGSANEEPGFTGISHLLEHMMFKGTRAIGTLDYGREQPLRKRLREVRRELKDCGEDAGPHDTGRVARLEAEAERLQGEIDALAYRNELWDIYRRHGAVGLNAGTGRDYTSYYCSLPAPRLELWMWLEADRMHNAVFRDFYEERDVVLEERRMSIDDSPNGSLAELLFGTAFIAHPYRWPVIGWKSDVAHITRDGIERYYRRYYAPNNAVVVIVGDIDTGEVKAMAERYFGAIAPRPIPPIVTVEPPQRGGKEAYLVFDAEPRVMLAFHKPEACARDSLVLDVIENILSSGRMSRLYRTLVDEKNIAVSVSAANLNMRFPSLFIVDAAPRAPHTVEEVETEIMNVISSLRHERVDDWELGKARNKIEADFVRMLQSTSGLASLIGAYEAIDRWEFLNEYVPGIRSVTADEIMEVADRYLKETNCTKVQLKRRSGR